MSTKVDIAISAMESMTGWAGNKPKWYEYIAAIFLLSPFIYELAKI